MYTLAHSPLDRSSSLPLYHQLHVHLRKRILGGEWKAGDLFPRDVDLEQMYGVSRITVRKALDALVDENLIARQRGRGTFVTDPSYRSEAGNLFSFTDEMKRRGLKPSSEVLDIQYRPVSEHTAEQLGVEVGEELAGLSRLRLGDGEPQCVEKVWLVHRYCPRILDHHDFSKASLTEVLEEIYHIRLSRAVQTVSALIPTRTIAKQLELRGNQPVLFVERVTYSQADIPIDYRRIYYRADRYALKQEVHKDGMRFLTVSDVTHTMREGSEGKGVN